MLSNMAYHLNFINFPLLSNAGKYSWVTYVWHMLTVPNHLYFMLVCIEKLRILVPWCMFSFYLGITMTSWWARWRLKSPASQLFTQPYIQAQMKENIKVARHWWPVNSPHKGPVTWKMFPFDDVIMASMAAASKSYNINGACLGRDSLNGKEPSIFFRLEPYLKQLSL